MGFLDKLFGEDKQEESGKLVWNFLEKFSLDEIEKNSFDKPQVLFKHSTRCAISRMALKQFENEYTLDSEKMDLYFLDLLAYREISNEVASRFGVVHQSPQILVIKEGKSVYNASHGDIQADELTQFV